MFARPRGCDEHRSSRGSLLVVRDVQSAGVLHQLLHVRLAGRAHAIADDRLQALGRLEAGRHRARHNDDAIDRLHRKRRERADQALVMGVERRCTTLVDELDQAVTIIDPDACQRIALLERESNRRRVVQVLRRRAVDEHGHAQMRGNIAHQHGDRRGRGRPGRENAQLLVRHQRVGLAQVEAIVAEEAAPARPGRIATGVADVRIVDVEIGAIGQRHDDGRLIHAVADARERLAAPDIGGRVRDVAARPRRLRRRGEEEEGEDDDHQGDADRGEPGTGRHRLDARDEVVVEPSGGSVPRGLSSIGHTCVPP
ncbi:MAG: hypothetical protein JWN49_286 [Parcubacteria group bacterium]|nr:hypothetical protein [Parcubacteria group bacterium]